MGFSSGPLWTASVVAVWITAQLTCRLEQLSVFLHPSSGHSYRNLWNSLQNNERGDGVVGLPSPLYRPCSIAPIHKPRSAGATLEMGWNMPEYPSQRHLHPYSSYVLCNVQDLEVVVERCVLLLLSPGEGDMPWNLYPRLKLLNTTLFAQHNCPIIVLHSIEKKKNKIADHAK